MKKLTVIKNLIDAYERFRELYTAEKLRHMSKTKAAALGSTSLGAFIYVDCWAVDILAGVSMPSEWLGLGGAVVGALVGVFCKLACTPTDEWFI